MYIYISICMYIYICMCIYYTYICMYIYIYIYTYIYGPKLGTYSDWGLSSVLVINKHLSHHGVSVSSPQILSFPLPASLKKGGMVMAVSPWYLVAWKTLLNVRNNFQEKDGCFLSISNINRRVSSFCRLDPSEFGLAFVKVCFNRCHCVLRPCLEVLIVAE